MIADADTFSPQATTDRQGRSAGLSSEGSHLVLNLNPPASATAAIVRHVWFNEKFDARPLATAQTTARLSLSNNCLCPEDLRARPSRLTAQASAEASSRRIPWRRAQRREATTFQECPTRSTRGTSLKPLLCPSSSARSSDKVRNSISSARSRGAAEGARGPRNRDRSRSAPTSPACSWPQLASQTPTPDSEASTAVTVAHQGASSEAAASG